jgi:hypothetical protein
LQKKYDESSVAENVKPARSFARNGMLCGLANGGTDLEAIVQPLPDCVYQTHRLSPDVIEGRFDALPGVGTSPALTKSSPPSSL